MSNGIVDNLLQGGTPPIFGPGPGGGDLPNPRDIPEIIIKDQAAQQLGNIFDNAGITAINPNMVVDLADAVIDDELSLGEAFDIAVDSTIAGGINKAAYGIPVFGQAKAGFDTIKQIEAILGRPLLPAEISQFASGIFSLPNIITDRILNFRRGITDDDDTGGGTTGGGTVIIGGQPTTTGVSGPAGMVVDPGAVSSSFGGRGGADRGGNVVIGGGADASQPDFTPGNVVIGGTTGTTPGPAGMGFTPPASKRRFPMGRAEGGLVSLAGYLKGR
tara:strand:- start:33 stop:854 length:822 start_codon:yes stop_codon:yes gene_type:complete